MNPILSLACVLSTPIPIRIERMVERHPARRLARARAEANPHSRPLWTDAGAEFRQAVLPEWAAENAAQIDDAQGKWDANT